MKTFRPRNFVVNAKFLLIAFLIVLLLLLNSWYPFLRFESPITNLRFGLILEWLPLCIAILAFFAQPRRIGITIAVTCLLISPILAIVSFFLTGPELELTHKDGYDRVLQPCSEVWQGSIRVRAFCIDGGTLGGDGLDVRQERRLMPGLLLVRDLYHEADTASGGTVENLRPGIVRIKPQSIEGKQKVIDVKLRSFFLP